MENKKIACHKGVYYPEKNESAVIRALLTDRIWEKKAYDKYRSYITDKHTVIDCGAFIGSHTLKFAELASKVYAFEPVPLIHHCLQLTLEQKNINNVILSCNALGSEKNDSIIYTNYNGDSSMDGIRNKRFNNNFKTKVDTLDNIIPPNEKIDFIKIDVEGSEWEVIEGATNLIMKWKPMIMLETWNSKKNIGKLNDFMKKYRYIDYKLNSENYLLFPKTLE